MQVSFSSSTSTKYFLAAAFMLTFVFSGCSATGPLRSQSAFNQSLPSGYQSPGFGSQPYNAPSANSFNGSGSRSGFGGHVQQQYQGFRGGMLNPFAGGGNFTSGSC